MQNQLTPGQSNLQQSNSNLQPNSSNLQQVGTPTGSSNVFTTLSQDAPTSNLTVQSAQTDPSKPSQTYLPGTSPAVWLVPFAITLAAIVALGIWLRLRKQEVLIMEETVPTPLESVKPAQVPKKKPGKKTTRRKRQTKR